MLTFETANQFITDLQVKSPEEKYEGLKVIRKYAGDALRCKKNELALQLTALGKSLQCPCPSLDYIRALAYLALDDVASAREALKEELRYFPDNTQAKEMLSQLPHELSRMYAHDVKFQHLYEHIAPYTMVGVQRIYNLYIQAVHICESAVQGNFVECGVAGGGSSGLLASVLTDKQQSARTLFCCDSFEGMPPATEFDTHGHVHAAATGWGKGTCAAPESSVLNLCADLGVTPQPTIVKGYFEKTLPLWKAQMGAIAFLHMDGDWYSSTKSILENLYDQLVPGAVVQVDDFGHWDGCRKAFDEFARQRSLIFTMTPIDSTGVWFIKNPRPANKGYKGPPPRGDIV